MNTGIESTPPGSRLRWLMACGLALTFGASACNGDISPLGVDPGSTGAGATTGGAGNPGTGGGSVSHPPPAGVDPGRVSIHRLNNLEYDNTIRDLLGVSGNVAQMTFQADEKGEFDNTADAFTMNDARYETYFNAADTIGEQVFANTALSSKILTCTPTNDTTSAGSCVQKIISDFGLRAWRRPVAAADLTKLAALAANAITLGETPANAIKQVVKTMIASPQFLYRIEFDASPTSLTPHSLDPYEMASRLSYLGWSTMPDDAMFALAKSGQITADLQITTQIDRMLADPKGATFTDSFAGQWLGARELKSHQVEPTAFKTFDEPLRTAMVQEELLYFNEFLTGTLPMTQFFTADVNFVNARLAQHYGVAAPTGTGMVKINNTADTRVGFMGLASFLTNTSFAYRTAPTLRGKWVLLNLLCQNIPAPPATVPKLDTGAATDPALQSQNVRLRLAAHRTQADCAACHKLLDPIGLGLENFDGIGAYRTKYAPTDAMPIDSSGVLPEGTVFTTVKELSAALSQGTRLTQLTDCASQKMMTYALSRSLNDTDQPYLQQVRTAWSTGTPSWNLKVLLKQIVLNDTFRFRRGEQ